MTAQRRLLSIVHADKFDVPPYVAFAHDVTKPMLLMPDAAMFV